MSWIILPNDKIPCLFSIPEGTGCRIFELPNDEYWLGTLMAAVLMLADSCNWQQLPGSLSPDDCAAVFENVLWASYDQALTGVCSVDVPAPYWDTAADAPAEASALEQAWYGVLTSTGFSSSRLTALTTEYTWTERIEDWTIAGFMAITGSPGAAIAFLTIAPRFRLALKTSDFATAVKIFVDSILVWAGVIPAATVAEIVEQDIFADQVSPDTSPHTVWVQQDGDGQMQVVRKKLDPNEVSPDNLRYSSTCDCVQQTNDGGATWFDQAGQDPRTSSAFALPLVGGTDPRCAAAANMRQWINDLVDQVITTLGLATAAATLVTTLVALFVELGPFAVVVDLFSGLAAVLFDSGATALSTAFTTTVYSEIQCVFYCYIGADGSVSAAQLALIETAIADTLGTGVANDVLQVMLPLMGNAGLRNAGVVGHALTVDCSGCSACNWCYEFDFTTTDGGFVADVYGGTPFGVYQPGVGWVSHTQNDGCLNHSYIEMRRTLGATLSGLQTAEIKLASPIGLDQHYFDQDNGATITHRNATVTTDGGLTYTCSPSQTTVFDTFSIQFLSCGLPAGFKIVYAKFSGTGTNPFGTDNC